ncbi:MAG TPA: hypothetical protein VLA66_08050, partial [Thermoanaerobaculia bacterium]|nr:hypothetical protein [Thermoanaerobaculia bacterium]
RLPPGRAAAIAEHLGRYRVMERVELEPGSPAGLVELRGERAPGLLAQLGIEAPEAPGDHAEAALAGVPLRIRCALRGREPRYELWIAGDAERGEAMARIRAAGAESGLVEPDAAALEAARIEDGELLWGIDYGEDAFPQETGEEGAISWTKGCYLGQEVVARIRYRGQAQRAARGLRFLDRLPEPGAPLLVDGREVGRATSVARSEAFGPIGLGVVHRRAGEPPARVAVEGGGAAELAPLPFA